ncbi:hypothetical protein [Marivivens marinus]|uniref:hypothetical protein n=1 Tax=Marivivens marinus TaxID=3110173 RepID=UPI003B848490
MKGIAILFFLTAVLCVTIGMGWGIQMSASQDHSLYGAHAHLNLVGWATMGLFGLYYAVTPQAAQGVLPKIHYALALLGVVLMVIGIVMVLTERSEMPVVIGSFLTIGSMLVFLYTVFRHGIGRAA